MFDHDEAAPSPEKAAAALAIAAASADPDHEPPSTLPGADLTDSMRNFAIAWLKTGVKSEAYRIAYPECKSRNTQKTEGARLSRDPRVLRFVEAVRQQVLDLSAISVSQIEHQAARIAFADLRLAFDPVTGTMRDPHEWPTDFALAVQGYREQESDKGSMRSLKLPDKNQALRLLAELKGALADDGHGDHLKASFHFHMGGKRAANADQRAANAEPRVVGSGSAVPESAEVAR